MPVKRPRRPALDFNADFLHAPAGMKDDGRTILVWDLPIRLFHWLLVVLVIAAYVTLKLNWMDWHAWAGDAVLALVLFRILWGFFGGDTDRFRNFVAAPRDAARYLKHLLRREPDRQVGHNPAGGWMVLLLLALLVGEALSGLYVANDVADEGPLTEAAPAWFANTMTALHSLCWDALLAAVTLHVAAIAVYAMAKGHNLVLPMVTGRKLLPQDVLAPRMGSALLAAVLLGGGVLIVAALATYL
jgi:cytochrome b